MTRGGKDSATLPERRVQSFLYLLLRDYLPSGDVELIFEMLAETDFDGPVIYSCPHTEALSGEMSRRLLGTGSQMADNEDEHEDRKEDNETEDFRPEESVKDLSDRERDALRKLDEALEDFRAKAARAIFSARPIGQGVYYEGFRQPKGKEGKLRATGEEDSESDGDEFLVEFIEAATGKPYKDLAEETKRRLSLASVPVGEGDEAIREAFRRVLCETGEISKDGGEVCEEFRKVKAQLDKEHPEGHVFNIGETVATGSNEDNARFREAEEDDRADSKVNGNGSGRASGAASESASEDEDKAKG